MNLKFTAYSRNERKIYSSGSDPVKISLDGKCIHTITGEELELGIVDWVFLDNMLKDLEKE